MQLSKFWTAVWLIFVTLWLIALPVSFVTGMYFLSKIPSRDTELRYKLHKQEEKVLLDALRKAKEESDSRG